MKKMKKEDLKKVFDLISEKEELYLPVKNAEKTNFDLYTKDSEPDFDTLKTVKSAKDIFFPQSETLYTCLENGGKIKIEPEKLMDRDFVVMGIRACDVAGMNVLDKVFLSDPVDTFYAARREHGTVVAFACSEPEESCFCSVFGITPEEPGADATMWIAGDEVFFKANTDKGEKFLEDISSLLTDSDDAKVEEQKKNTREIMEKLPYTKLSLEGWGIEEKTDELFDSPLWQTLYSSCLACGTCTFSCPTCQCYDIKDYTANGKIQLYRCWDSCMYSDFTMMAHGNNRTSQMQRFRQRFMHKLQYFPVNNGGMFSCVGCGRCVDRCPSSLNIVKVIKAFSKEGLK